jgi:transcriptional regulator with XRE-family HTH domain
MNNIKKLRGREGLTQIDLANQINVTRALIVKLEKDTCHSTSQSTTEALCERFNVSPCELYGLDNLKYMPQSKEDCLNLINLLEEEMKKWD